MKNLFIELADTHDKRTKGLMHRKYLNKNSGMLFRFPYFERLSFWMKNTYVPLDIAFIDNDGKIFQIENMIPLNTRAILSNHPCQYALEVNKGWFNGNDIRIGSRVGGYGLKVRKIAQNDIQTPSEHNVESPDPDIMLNMTHKERLEHSQLKGQDMIIIYQTKKGKILPPKVISPPYIFEKDEDGHHDAVVKAWDNQEAGWKSFLIDNIISMEDKK